MFSLVWLLQLFWGFVYCPPIYVPVLVLARMVGMVEMPVQVVVVLASMVVAAAVAVVVAF